MKFKQLMIFLTVLLLSFSIATANEQYLSSVAGLNGMGNIPTDGSTVTFTIGMNQTGPGNITGWTNGFRIYSTNGAGWTSTSGAFTGTITTGMAEQTFINTFSADGALSDTIGFAGFRLFAPGIPSGFHNDVWTITIGPVAPADNGKQICLDSSFYRPGGAWTWSTSVGDVFPTWDGPHCYLIGEVVADQPPVLEPIGNKAIKADCGILTFDVSATDPQGYTLSYITSTLPGSASFTDHGDGTGTFSWTPTGADVGPHDITFTVTAATSGLSDQEIITITVNPNSTPTITNITNKTVAECDQLQFTIFANDADGTIPAITGTVIPSTAVVADNGDGTAIFSWTPVKGDVLSSPFAVTVSATDECGASADRSFNITVTANSAPVITPVADVNTKACQTVNIGFTATDPDDPNTQITLSLLNKPANAVFVDNHDGTGSFTWNVQSSDVSGSPYSITLQAEDLCGNVSSDVFQINVDLDDAPDITVTTPQVFTLCKQKSFSFTASDPQGTNVSISVSGITAIGATFTDNGGGSGTITWTPSNPSYVGNSYDIVITAEDQCGSVFNKTVTLSVVDDANPVMTAIGARSVTACGILTISLSANDPDGSDVDFRMTNAPVGSSLVNNPDASTATFTWSTSQADTLGSPYSVTFYATDECGSEVSEVVAITVNKNASPNFPAIADINNAIACKPITVNFSATDAESGTITFTKIGSEHPDAVVTNTGNGTGTFTWTPGSEDISVTPYTFTIRASDGCSAPTDVSFDITVINDSDPVLDPIGNKSVMACQQWLFPVSADDPDGLSVTLSVQNKPASATFIDNGNGTGSFTWTPTADDVADSPYSVTFVATDGCGSTSQEVISITVTEDSKPVLADITDKTIKVCQLLTIQLTATDPENTQLTFNDPSSDFEPVNSTFNDNHNGTATVTITPTVAEIGAHQVIFSVYDECGSIAADTITLTIIADGQPTVARNAGDTTVMSCQPIELTYSASDPEGAGIIYTALGLDFAGGQATFNDDGAGSGTLTWTPTLADANDSVVIKVIVTDDCGTVSDTTIDTIFVLDDDAPVLAVADADTSHTTTEGIAVTFGFSTTDAQGSSITYSLTSASTHASVTKTTGTNDGTFLWEPVNGENGIDSLWIVATDGCGSKDSQLIVIEVLDNKPPVFAEGATPTPIQQGGTFQYEISVNDSDMVAGKLTPASVSGNTSITIWVDTASVEDNPSKWSLVDNGDGTALFTWNTDMLTIAKTYHVTFVATDGVDTVEAVVDFDVATSVSVIAGSGLPEEFYLAQNYPNPFNPETEIEFGIAERTHVHLAVYNVLGQKIKILFDDILAPNVYSAYWDGTSDQGVRVASGIYFYKLESSLFNETKKMVMLK